MAARSMGKIDFYVSLRESAAAGASMPNAVELLFEACAPESFLSESLMFRLLEAYSGRKAPPLKVELPRLHALAAKLQDGISFSAALAGHGDEFQPWEIAVLRVGERTGRMDEAFGYLARILEARRADLLNLTAAAARPLLIQALAPWIVCAPLAVLAGFFVYLCVASAGFLVMTPALKILTSSRTRRSGFNPACMPGFCKMQFCHCLAGLITAGVSIDEAIREAAGAAQTREFGESGEPVHARLRRYGMFSSEELACLRISEECGKLDEGLKTLAEGTRRAFKLFESAAR